MQLIGLARLGRDAELRHTAAGDPVTNLSLAWNYGRKDDAGKRPTQWVEASLWGKLAESLVEFLTSGKLVCVTLDDVHTEEYEGRSGPGFKLVGKVTAIELAGSPGGERAPAPAARAAGAPAPAPRAAAPRPAAAPAGRAPAPKAAGGFDDMDDDMDDDIPF